MIGFLKDIGAQALGGVFAAWVALMVIYINNKYHTFEVRYLNPDENLTAEHMQKCTALSLGVGSFRFRLSIRPHKGLILTKYSIAFFDKGGLPWFVGRRRNINEIKIYKMRYYDLHSMTFKDANLRTFDSERSYSDEPCMSLPNGSCAYYEFDVFVDNSLKHWEGVLSFQLHYERDGNPEKQDVRTKIFVRAEKERKPFSSILYRVLRAKSIEQRTLAVTENPC